MNAEPPLLAIHINRIMSRPSGSEGPGFSSHESVHDEVCILTSISAQQALDIIALLCDNYNTVGGDGGCRVGEVRASTTSPMPDHKGFKLQ